MIKILFGLGVASLLTAPALATTASSTMQVKAKVSAGCAVVSTQNMDFGELAKLDTAVATGGVTFNCTEGTVWFVSADTGKNSAATQTQMTGKNSGNKIKYNMYSDQDRTMAFPTAVGTLGAGTTGGTGNKDATNSTVPIYGKIPTGQGAFSVDDYSDTVQLTISF
jgi:spore coat protein U-like protein